MISNTVEGYDGYLALCIRVLTFGATKVIIEFIFFSVIGHDKIIFSVMVMIDFFFFGQQFCVNSKKGVL